MWLGGGLRTLVTWVPGQIPPITARLCDQVTSVFSPVARGWKHLVKGGLWGLEEKSTHGHEASLTVSAAAAAVLSRPNGTWRGRGRGHSLGGERGRKTHSDGDSET